MKIIVTGATGFIGSHFVDLAISENHEVVAHRQSSASLTAINLKREPIWITGPLSAVDPSVFSDCDVLVHLAATGVSPKPATWEHCLEFNGGTALNLTQKAAAAGVKRIVVAGTCAEYGRSGQRFARIPADAPLEPNDPYAASKAAAGIMLASLARQQRLEFYYGRIFSVYGEGQSAINFWPQLRHAALTGQDFPMTQGEQIRDFCRVEDVASTLLRACSRSDLTAGEPMIVNVGSGNAVTLAEFAQQWWSIWKAEGKLLIGVLPYRDNEVMRYVPLLPQI
jgi:UDP-glucose 4-epimerase